MFVKFIDKLAKHFSSTKMNIAEFKKEWSDEELRKSIANVFSAMA